MKKLTLKFLFWLLKKYTKTEVQRLEVYNLLFEQTQESYREQNVVGNFYNAYIEFIISNSYIKNMVRKNDEKALDSVNSGLQESFKESLNFIIKEKL